MIQTPAVFLPSAARGCWLVWYCRAALRRFREFPNLRRLERIKPMAGESEHGSDGASAPSRPLRQPAALLSLHRQTEPCTNGAAAYIKGPLPRSSTAMDILASAAPGESPAMSVPGRGCSCLCLCRSRPRGRSGVGTWTQDAGGRVPRLIPGLQSMGRQLSLIWSISLIPQAFLISCFSLF